MSEKGEIFEPALKNWADLKKYQLPDLAEPVVISNHGNYLRMTTSIIAWQ